MRNPAPLEGTATIEMDPFSADLLAQDLELPPALYEQISTRLMEAFEIARKTLAADNFSTGFKETFEGAKYDLAPGQVALYLPASKTLPEMEIEAGFGKTAVQAFLSHDISYYQTIILTQLGIQPRQPEVSVALDLVILTITRNPLGCYFSNLRNQSPHTIHYIPEVEGLDASTLRKIEKPLKQELEESLTSPALKSEWENFPDWLLICPRSILSQKFLSKHKAFSHTLVRALEQHIFLRGCAALHFDDVLSKPEYEAVWDAFFKKHAPHKSPVSPSYLPFIQAILTFKGKPLPQKFERYFRRPKTEAKAPASVAATTVTERVRPIVESAEITFFQPTPLSYQVENENINLSAEANAKESNLHIVVWEKTNSGNRRNPRFYSFSSTEDKQVPKPNKRFEIAAFWCNKKAAFKSQSELSAVPDSAYCETMNATPRTPEPAKKSVSPQPHRETNTYTIDTSTSRDPAMIAAAERLTEALNWQEELALKLMECLDHFDQVFDEPTWHNNNEVSFHVQGEGSNAYFTVQIEPLRLTNPNYEIVENYLKEEALPLLISWAQSKKEQTQAKEQLSLDRAAVAEWRQANDFRKAKGNACREAIGFRSWEDYQQGTHKGPNGLELPLYAWDKACVSRSFLPKLDHLLDQLAQAGVKVSYEKALLQSGRQRDVILDSLAFEMSDTNLKFKLRINREAESPSEIFKLEFDDLTPEPWRNEAARWAIGTICMMGIITLPKDKSPLNAGKQSRPNHPGHFTFKINQKRARQSRESKSSYLNLIHRLNENRGRIKAVASAGRGFEWDGSWADFADAGFSVYQNAFFKEEPHRDSTDSKTDYELILKDERWQKYAILRLWKTMKQGLKVGDLDHRSSVGPYSEKMAEVAQTAWQLMSPEEQTAFSKITSPSEAAQFTFKHGEAENCNFIRTLISMWQAAEIGLFVQAEPIYVTFDSVLQHCQIEEVEIIARSQADLDAIEEVGLPDLKIIQAF